MAVNKDFIMGFGAGKAQGGGDVIIEATDLIFTDPESDGNIVIESEE